MMIAIAVHCFPLYLDIDDCENFNCSGNGKCKGRVSGFLICECNPGFFGDNCETGTFRELGIS